MNYQMIGFVIGRILLTEAALLMLPMAVALVYGEPAAPFLLPALLLAVIGVNMLREAFSREEEEEGSVADLSVRTMFTMAVATSIDALAVGISLAMAGGVNILGAVILIGVTTFALSAVGVKVGSVFGSRFEKKAEAMGGVILIALGVKILLEHLGVL